MIARRQMAYKVNVIGPGKSVWVLCTAHQELAVGQAAGRFDEQLFERPLAVCRESAHVRKVALELGTLRRRMMYRRVNATINRYYSPGTKPCGQFVERSPTRVTEHQVEVR